MSSSRLNPRDNPACSPCIGRCSHNVGDAICTGCGRTVAEVLNWASLTDAEKIALKIILKERLNEQS